MRTITPPELQPAVALANCIAVARDHYWGPRGIQDYELVLVLAGRFAYERPGQPLLPLRTGQVLCIPPGETHVLRRIDRGVEAAIACIHQELVPWGRRIDNDYRLVPNPETVTETQSEPEFRRLFRAAAAACEQFGRYRQLLLDTIALEIWLRLAEWWERAAGAPTTTRLARMLEFLYQHLTEPVSRQDLAAAFSLTPEYINAIFQRELGLSPTAFVQRERVKLATHLLQEEGLTVQETARQVGFGDPFYFSRIFKRLTGTPPSRIRSRRGPADPPGAH